MVLKIRGQSLLAAWTARPQNEPPSKRTPLSSFDTVLVDTPKRPSSVTEISFKIENSVQFEFIYFLKLTCN